MKDFFPITLCDWHPVGGGGSHEFREIFLTHKPKDKHWYAYTVIVKSQTRIQFLVYDIRDTVYGGVGREIYRFSVNIPYTAILSAIKDYAEKLARLRREKELKEQEELIISKYTHEILSKL